MAQNILQNFRSLTNIADSVCTRRGRQIGARHTVIPEDGKTMTAAIEGINAQGRVSALRFTKGSRSPSRDVLILMQRRTLRAGKYHRRISPDPVW